VCVCVFVCVCACVCVCVCGRVCIYINDLYVYYYYIHIPFYICILYVYILLYVSSTVRKSSSFLLFEKKTYVCGSVWGSIRCNFLCIYTTLYVSSTVCVCGSVWGSIRCVWAYAAAYYSICEQHCVRPVRMLPHTLIRSVCYLIRCRIRMRVQCAHTQRMLPQTLPHTQVFC